MVFGFELLNSGERIRVILALLLICYFCYTDFFIDLFSSPGRSPGRGIILPPASALALLAAAAALATSLTLKFFM